MSLQHCHRVHTAAQGLFDTAFLYPRPRSAESQIPAFDSWTLIQLRSLRNVEALWGSAFALLVWKTPQCLKLSTAQGSLGFVQARLPSMHWLGHVRSLALVNISTCCFTNKAFYNMVSARLEAEWPGYSSEPQCATIATQTLSS